MKKKRIAPKKPRAFIPYSRQAVGESDIRAVVKVMRSAYLTQGPAIASFEKAVAAYCKTRFAVALNSGTAALHAAYAAAGIGSGDEVIVPALTFAATANAALYLGAKPVFADVDLACGLIDPANAEALITPKTKAIVGVDYAGRPAALAELRAIAKKHSLVFIEDAAQSLGATYQKKPIGTQADMTMFSFHPVKSITTGEGGVIVTDSEAYYNSMMMFRTHGITKDASLLIEKNYAAWYMEMHTLGYNYRMTDIQAALGESQFKRLDSFVAKRRAAAARYKPLLKDIAGIILPPDERKGETSAWHLYTARLAPEVAHKRDQVFTGLREKGIGVQVHHLPVYLHPYYARLGYPRGLCPNAEEFVFSEISLPLFPGITKSEQQYVADALRELMAR